MTYKECVVNTAIAIFSSRQISGPQAAIDLAEHFADAVRDRDYLEKDPEPLPIEHKPKKTKHPKHGPSSTTGDDRVGAGSSKD